VGDVYTGEMGGLVYTDGKEEGFYTEDVDAVKGILEKHGVCVYGRVLDAKECAAMNHCRSGCRF
jgi:hypothetical protein